MLTLRNSSQGSFMVEFSIVGLLFALALAFCVDAVIKMTVKGKLDRMSYSGVSIIKERTQLFNDSNFTVTEDQFEASDKIIQASLQRTMTNFDQSRFGSLLEVQTFQTNAAMTPDAIVKHEGGGLKCSPATALDPGLAVVTSWGRKTTLYRLTLCYETDNWYGALVGEDYRIVTSSSLMVGR